MNNSLISHYAHPTQTQYLMQY